MSLLPTSSRWRAFGLRWLVGLISQTGTWLPLVIQCRSASCNLPPSAFMLHGLNSALVSPRLV
ncbi:hypothetical protein [Thermogemmatispora carboxidivorans]|uniref:hypothetical protein n=1 Tax=Thermogemmatispora carboxidivorans TaxID=1382306 RepID=UPI00069A235F|nr:hypothetical protein [Thermogemmatispora carboxidivorans]